VRTYVSQLRRRFGLPIETTPAGYILAVPRESVDALRFEHLVEAARREDDTSRRVTLLGDALALWRGEALAEFAGLRWADEQARSWERLRREVVQERVRTRLASGEDAALIGELERLVEQFPFDEQLTADLMLACYRSGRQADALREYAGLRHRLAHELGIDPSADLAELERRMLDHDPSLDFADTTRAWFGPTSPIVDALPEGVVTFLLTDIECSTELWDRHAVEMSGALVQHEEVINGIVGSHRGRLLKSRGEGDATLSVFSVATDAVAAAVALQRTLGGTTWQGGLSLATRVAVHAGEAHLREGDYYGGTLNRAARIRSLAAGGQVLLSRATHDLVVDTLANDLSLVELGAYELRGLHRDETVFAVAAAGLAPVAPPAGRAAGLSRGPANTFVGRAGTLGQLAAELEVPGLVTITGPGEIGKTRLL
jgi:class 3 adenylate cyclase